MADLFETCEECGKTTFESQVNYKGKVLCCECWDAELVYCPDCKEKCESLTCPECGAKTGIEL